MFKNYFKIAFRNLGRNKAYTLTNVLGLTLGIGCAILIFFLVRYHLSFDTFHANKDRIYRITSEFHQESISYNPGTPPPLGKAFRSDYTFAEKVARVATFKDQVISIPSTTDNKKFQDQIAYAEPAFFEILDFPLVQGNKTLVLTEPNTAIITERIARKYFGTQEPVGQIFRVANKIDFKVTGILKDIPANTDRREEIYLSYTNLKDQDPQKGDDSRWNAVHTDLQCFILLKPNISAETVDKALPDLSRKYYNEQDAKESQFKLQPIADMHFNANLGGYVDKRNLWALALLGVFLVITACANFINLATAKALTRSREIGVRKALGSFRSQIFWQFIAETTVIVVLSLILAFALIQVILPALNDLLGVRLGISVFWDAYLFLFLSLITVAVIFLSGSYPGLILSGFQPVLALKGKLSQKHTGGASLRKGLVITQFAISQLLIISTIVIVNQMHFSRKKDLGFQKDAIIMLPVPDKEKSKISTLNTQLSQIAGVEKISFCSNAPAAEKNFRASIRLGSHEKDENFEINFKVGDERYISTFGLKLVSGRNLYPPDSIYEFLVNETTVKKLGMASNEEILNQKVTINGLSGTVVGVVKDFHNNSFHAAIEALCIVNENSWWYNNCAVKINPASLKPTLSAIESAWSTVYPSYVYKYDFLDEQVARFYELDYMILRLIQSFTVIAILISCLGLYGLASFMAAQKTKEIGVRKALGASTESIVWLFGKEFGKLVFIALIFAVPLSWWMMSRWLNNFQYRINIGISTFLLSTLLTVIIVVFTVGYRTVKAALLNPVKSLRSE
jgi:putative ABC transport system permease protein